MYKDNLRIDDTVYNHSLLRSLVYIFVNTQLKRNFCIIITNIGTERLLDHQKQPFIAVTVSYKLSVNVSC